MSAGQELTLTAEQVQRLRAIVCRWHREAERPGNGAGIAVLDLAMEVRELLGMEPKL